MNTWIKKNFNIILIIFLLLQPILDLITGIGIHLWHTNITVGIIIRMIFLLFILYSVLFVYKRKKNLLFYGILAIYGFFYIVGMLIYKNGVGLFSEIQGLCRVFYFPVLLISLYSIKEEIKISKMTLIVILITYLVCILVPNCLNLGFKTYEITKAGTLGFFNSANEISGIISILTPIMILILVNERKILLSIIIGLLYLYVILTIGTKTPLLSLGITIFFAYIWFIHQEIKLKRVKRVAISVVLLIIFIAGMIIILPKTNFYKNIETHLEFLEVDNITEVFQDKKLIDHFIFSERLTFLENRYKDYRDESQYLQLFGIGYLKDGNDTKAIEMDYFDIYYSHGMVGFIIYFGIYGYFFYLIMKNRKKLDFTQYMLYISIVLSVLLSFITGHIITAPAVSILLIVLLLLLEKHTYERILFIGNDLNIDRLVESKIKTIDVKKYEIDFLLVTKKIKQKNNLQREIKITKYSKSSSTNKIIQTISNTLKLFWYQIINYQMYDKCYCYQEYDKLKNNLGKISSPYYNIYIDKTNRKRKELIIGLPTDKIKHIVFKTEKDRKEFLSNNPELKEKCLLVETV